MKIGAFITEYPYDRDVPGYFTGGTGHVAKQLAVGLRRLGHEISVFTSSCNRQFSTEDSEGVRVVRYPTLFTLSHTHVAYSLISAPTREAFDITHAHAGNPPATVGAYRAAKRNNAPLVITYHGDFQGSYGSLARRAAVHSYSAWFTKRMLPAADAIICPSGPFVDDSPVLRHFRDKVEIIPNSIDLAATPHHISREKSRDSLGIAVGDVVVLFVGSLVPYKGPDVLLEAFAKALQEEETLRLIYVGGGPLRTSLENRAREMRCEKRVSFLGPVSDSVKWGAFAAADIFTLPSTMRTENFPIVLLEAQAFGLPLLTSDLPTFGALVEPGRNGLLSKRADVDDLAKRLACLASDPTSRVAMGRESLRSVEQYDVGHILEKTQLLFRRLIE